MGATEVVLLKVLADFLTYVGLKRLRFKTTTVEELGLVRSEGLVGCNEFGWDWVGGVSDGIIVVNWVSGLVGLGHIHADGSAYQLT